METSKAYNKLLNEVEDLQNNLMDIEDYSEEDNNAFQRLIDQLDVEPE